MSEPAPSPPELPAPRSRRRHSRRIWAATSLGAARLRARPGRTLLVLVGVGAASAMLVGVLGGSLITQNRALERAIAELPRSQQSFRVDLLGLLLHQAYSQPDRPALAALSQLAPRRPLRVAYLRDAWLDGEFVRVVGIDQLADHVRLRSGRLPQSCRPTACEVLQIGNRGRRVLSEGGINLVRVGVGELRDPQIFGPTFKALRQYRAQRSLVTSTVLLVPNSMSFAHLPAVQVLFVVRSWIAPLEASKIRSWQITSILQRETQAQTSLEQASPYFALVGPDAALLDVAARGNIYRQRTILIGGGAAVLLLGFAMVAAAALRRGIATERWRLVQRGATAAQVWLALVSEVGTIVLAGWLIGLAVGASAIGLLADSLGQPAGAVIQHTLLDRNALLALLLVGAVAAAVVLGTTLVRGQARYGRVRPLDVAAVGAALTVAIGLTRGSLSADALAAGGDKTLLLLLPGLVCFAAAVAAARLLAPLMALAERPSRRGSTAVRVALLALARAPIRTELAAAFLVITVALALFAAGYRATLERGAHDESGFAVPLDETLSEGSRLVRPIDAAPLQRYDRLSPDVHAYSILRRSADVPGSGTSAQAITVLGVPPSALARMYWRSDFSAVPRSQLAAEIGQDGSARLRGLFIPGDAAALSVHVRVRGSPVRLDLAVEDARGRIETLPLGAARDGASTLVARLPQRLGQHAARRITGLELSLPLALRNWFFHLANEGRAVRAPTGSLLLRSLRATTSAGRERSLVDWGGWLTPNQGASIRPGRRVRIAYSFAHAQTLLFRPREPTDGHPLRVIASPGVAQAAGTGRSLTLDFIDNRIPVRIVATASRFPTLQPEEQFVVADETRLATALDADAPGTGEPGELWLRVPGKAVSALTRALSNPRFATLIQTSRRQQQKQMERDPMARGISYTLGTTALIALALATIGIWLTLLSDLRDERGHFLDLEGQGVAPETLRSHLRIRAGALLGFGIVGGAFVGFVLSRLVVSLVQVSAETSVPQPPLVTDMGLTVVGVALSALVVGAVVVAEVSARRAFAGDTPKRASGSFE